MSLVGTSDVREPEVIVHQVVERPVSVRRRVITGSLLVAVGLLCALGLGLGSRAGFPATFKLSAADEYVAVPDLVLPARIVGLVLGFVIVALGVYQLARGFSRRQLRWVV